MMRHQIRGFLGVKSNDGHDAPLLVVAELLQEAGIEVVYGGFDLSVDQMVRATIQEGLHFTGISSYNGGHIPYFLKVRDGLRAKGWPFVHLIGGGGATITEDDIRILTAEGIDRVFGTGEGPAAADYITRTFDFPVLSPRPLDLLPGARSGDSMAMGLLMNHLEERARLEGLVRSARDKQGVAEWTRGSGAEVAALPIPGTPWTVGEALERMAELDRLFPADAVGTSGKGRVIGFTGRGGSGKSTLIDQMVRLYFADPAHEKRRLALLAVDPSSPRTGGAVLADRMSYVYATDRRWVDVERIHLRSMASRGMAGGICRALTPVLALLRACDYDVMVETYGTGQPDTDLHPLVDRSVFVTTPDFGGAAQLHKEAMLSMPGVRVVLNKQDLSGGAHAGELLRSRLGKTPLFQTCAVEHEDPGVAALYRDVWGTHASD